MQALQSCKSRFASQQGQRLRAQVLAVERLPARTVYKASVETGRLRKHMVRLRHHTPHTVHWQ